MPFICRWNANFTTLQEKDIKLDLIVSKVIVLKSVGIKATCLNLLYPRRELDY